ncbi:hypothetical protein CKAH01_18835 [Colletotrichum kahawae]|uniref:Uncharacterized protein n=1 Tax=Colletotrichum kahawae TaxID=34407 RepID=A0AAE0D0W0_COLKA|nr:hypothetical protein CKAH01_18835 [Colletotrichum kahawae]
MHRRDVSGGQQCCKQGRWLKQDVRSSRSCLVYLLQMKLLQNTYIPPSQYSTP